MDDGGAQSVAPGMILAADVGGTNTRMGLFELAGDRLVLAATEIYPSQEHGSLEAIVGLFRALHPRPADRACFAVAGPVEQGHVSITNLAWTVEADRLAAAAGVGRIRVINDLEALAHGLDELGSDDLATLSPGAADAVGNLAILAAGTGLGQAASYWDGARHHPFASEGGHADFAPRNDLEMELLRHLLGIFHRVSYERLLSGAGLLNIYGFLRQTGRDREPATLTELLSQQPHPARIVRAALEGRSERCVRALELFASIYGAEAGNLALKVMARGGVFLGGGIASTILQWLRSPVFMDAFLAKGRMRPLLETIPVRVILNDRAGLWGAARYAALGE